MTDSPTFRAWHGSTINPPVFLGSSALILLIVAWGVLAPENAGRVFADVQAWIVGSFGWLYMLAVAAFVVFVVALAASPYGTIRLGPPESRPDFSYTAWFAMLFSAGMGIGLMFYGVAEPIFHYTSPPLGEGGDAAAAREAMTITFFHWGVHAWAIYAVVALALAYFSFRHDLPLTVRSALYPLIGRRIHGPIGHTVDIFAVLGTMFGVATSLGLGVMQVNAGLNHLFGIANTVPVQLILIAVVTLMATGSVVAGLDKGIRRLSELNIILAVAIVAFVLLAGPTLFLLNALVENLGGYLSDVVNRTFLVYAYQPTDWMASWTLFYWGWWIAWSPFVGMFIARVSRGRTIREFVVGVLLVPVAFTFVWMTAFGNSALALDLGMAQGAIGTAVNADVATALFKFLAYLPLAEIASGLATILVVTFFVTSSDSGSMVIDIITSGGTTQSPVWQRVFWAVGEGVVAAALLLAGGLGALQTASIAAALPFVLVMLVMCVGLWRGLQMEGVRRTRMEVPGFARHPAHARPWRKRLASLVHYPDKAAVTGFLADTAAPALREVASEIEAAGLRTEVEADTEAVRLTVRHDGERAFVYAVRLTAYRAPTFAFPEFTPPDEPVGPSYWRAEVHLLEGSQHYDVMPYDREELIADVIAQYEKHMHFLHTVRDTA